ncbi:unnamed protein product [Owenia fusiformis]|uniref:Uncharacterized protein n=1 Tax=Owenia fusiformis TaxID=6347 RepID=A0A8J1UFN3_OWEFU|nr:unnamed protein product [Owenia fusiformis]
MENFVLYEEIGSSETSHVYKGRRKGTITFLAIHCVDKCKRAEITNTVRLTYEVEHTNIVKFHEWYETSNHLWLVVELCTGGSLATIISQDHNLPESSIRKFGVDLVLGLQYIHSNEIVFSDLKPSKVLLDSTGHLKYGDFGLARLAGEDLGAVFEQYAEASETWSTENSDKGRTTPMKGTQGSPNYMAPECLLGEPPSQASDMWSLGCVLYEMYAGHPPFVCEDFREHVTLVTTTDFPPPKVKGSRLSSKPSPDFLDLLGKLLKRKPVERLNWSGLIKHPFWNGVLAELSEGLTSRPGTSLSPGTGVSESNRDSVSQFKAASVMGKIKGLDVDIDTGGSSMTAVSPLPDMMESMRPKSVAEGNTEEPVFALSSHVCPGDENDERITSPQKPNQQHNMKTMLLNTQADNQEDDLTETPALIEDIIFHDSDLLVTPIVDNPKIQKPGNLKYDNKTLPVPPYSVEKILSTSRKDKQKHLDLILDTLATPEKGPPSQKRMHFLNYVTAICYNDELASYLMNKGIIGSLVKHIKDNSTLELRVRLARTIAVMSNNTSILLDSTKLAEAVSMLSDVIRDNFRNSKVKQALLPALGELVFLIAKQEEAKGESVDNWLIPSMTFTLITRCLREGEDAIVNHYAAKIVENLLSTTGQYANKLVANDVGQFLWYIFTHSTVDALRITAITALCRISRCSVNIFQSIIDKVGLPKILDTLSIGVSKIQQALVTMFGLLLSTGSHVSRLWQDKSFIQKVMRLLESQSAVVRGKAYVVTTKIISSNPEMFLTCCQMRLVMYVERDSRRSNPSKSQSTANVDYLVQCLSFLIDSIVRTVPRVCGDVVSALDAVHGRKHPSSAQAKDLKTSVPMVPVILHLITSQVFRPRIVGGMFLHNMGSILKHVKELDAGETNIDSAVGASGSQEFIHTVFSIIEAIVQHQTILTEHHVIIVDSLLAPLSQLITSSNGDTRVFCLRLFTEIATTYLGEQQLNITLDEESSVKLQGIIVDALLPQYEQILLDQDPLPAYGLKLLLALLEQNQTFVKKFEELGLVAVLFQVLLDHQTTPVSVTMQSIVGIVNHLVAHRDTNMKDLYDQGLVDHITNLFIEVTSICMDPEEPTGDLKTAVAMLQLLLDTMHCILKFVSDYVRKALQAKKGGSTGYEAERAEQLLLTNKPLTDVLSLLTQLLCHDDTDIQELSLKCLSIMTQLFGGENPDAMSNENMECYSNALRVADSKKQKLILRIIKRLISVEHQHADSIREDGGHLVDTLRDLCQTASSHADVALSSLASELLKLTGHLT